MASSVLSSLPLLLVTAGIALLAASFRITWLSRNHRQRMESLLQLAQREIEPLEFPALAWPYLAEAGWQHLAWEGNWFGQPVSGAQGMPGKSAAAALHFETGGEETPLRLRLTHAQGWGEKRLFADQLARVFVLLLETRLRARSETLAATLVERARLSLYLQHDMRNLAQWVCWVCADFTGSPQPEALHAAAKRLRDNAPLARERAERLIAALGQHKANDPPEWLDLRQAILQAAQLAGFQPEIDGEARAWAAKSLLARALDNLFANLAPLWRTPATLRPVFQLRAAKQAEIDFFCPWLDDLARPAPEKLFEPFASGRPGGLGLGLYQARKSLTEAGGELNATLTPEGLKFLIQLPQTGEL